MLIHVNTCIRLSICEFCPTAYLSLYSRLRVEARGGVMVKVLCYKNRQVAGSIPDGLLGIFQ